jgi:hypothetical protein
MNKDIPSTRLGEMYDDVYPIHLLDNAKDYRNLFMSYLFRFNDILDSNRLADSLTKLLEIGHWRKLGGRLRLKVINPFRSSLLRRVSTEHLILFSIGGWTARDSCPSGFYDQEAIHRFYP